MPQQRPTDGAFLAVDLDNLLNDEHWNPDQGIQSMVRMIFQLETLTSLTFGGGFVALNRATLEQLAENLAVHLNPWRIQTGVVGPTSGSAVKLLCYAIGRAAGEGFRRFVIVSKDKGFAEVAQRLLADYPERGVELFVAVDRSDLGLHNCYTPIDGVQLVELPRPRPQTVAPPAPVRARPPVTPAPGVPPFIPITPPVVEPEQDDSILICDMCGRRLLMSWAARNGRCRTCGTAMRTASFFGEVLLTQPRRTVKEES